MRSPIRTALTELNERARIADSERMVAVARANAECRAARAVAAHLERWQPRARLGVQRTTRPNSRTPTRPRDLYRRARTARLAQVETSRQTRVSADHQRTALRNAGCDGMNLRATVAGAMPIFSCSRPTAARHSGRPRSAAVSPMRWRLIDPNVPKLHADISDAKRAPTAQGRSELARAQSRERMPTSRSPRKTSASSRTS